MSFDPTVIVSRAPRGARRKLIRPPFGKAAAFAAVSIAAWMLFALAIGSAMHAGGFR
ncbi:hypothetical protein [Phenylobacterium sp.]|uniref:hypothetical protein n=1 Tax=Phenylobacterium sp. TaxID=1871053 RepID=UPI002DE392DD|nr:hypothetical protein [Phenylobacterium sp.]